MAEREAGTEECAATSGERGVPVDCRDCGAFRLCAQLGLGTADSRPLERVVKRRQVVKRGRLLFRSGDPFATIYALRAGSVKSCVAAEDGRVQIIGLHLGGELLGLSGMDGGRYTSDAVALETVSVCELSAARLEAEANAIPAINRQMLRVMSGQIRNDEELMLLLGRRGAEARLAAFLLGLSVRLARRRYSPRQFTLRMSRGEIGNYLGIAEETVCRLLTRFQKMRLIAVRRRQVELLDPDRLRDVANRRSEPAGGRRGAAAPPGALRAGRVRRPGALLGSLAERPAR